MNKRDPDPMSDVSNGFRSCLNPGSSWLIPARCLPLSGRVWAMHVEAVSARETSLNDVRRMTCPQAYGAKR